jgi:hypothetical protein
VRQLNCECAEDNLVHKKIMYNPTKPQTFSKQDLNELNLRCYCVCVMLERWICIAHTDYTATPSMILL